MAERHIVRNSQNRTPLYVILTTSAQFEAVPSVLTEVVFCFPIGTGMTSPYISCGCYSLVLRHMRYRVLASANQLVSKIMDQIQGPLNATSRAARAYASGVPEGVRSRPNLGQNASTIVIGAALAGAMLLAVVAALYHHPGDAAVLAVLTLLGMIGVFFLFAASVGLVQFGVRDQRNAIEQLIMRSPDGVLVVASDGTTVRHNPAFASLTSSLNRSGASGHVPGRDRSLEVIERFFQVSSSGEGAFFRLMRAARMGQSAEEILYVSEGAAAELVGTWRVSVAGLVDLEGVDRATEWRVVHLPTDAFRSDGSQDPLTRDMVSFESLPYGTLIASREGRILSANAHLRSLIGLKADTLETETITLADVLPHLATSDAMQTEARLTMLHRTDGTELACRAAVARQVGDTGRLIVAVDATVENGGNNAVNLTENQGANLFNAAPIAIAVVDEKGAIESANDAFARMFGSESKNLISCVTPETRDHVKFALNAATDGDLHPAPVEIAVGENGERKGRVFISPVYTDESESESAIVYAIDMTKQRELEAQFAQGQKMQAVGQLAGGMAHDFNNLLTIITLSSDFLLASHQKSDPAFKDIMQIKQVAGRAAEIVKQLLAFSRQQTLLPEVLSLTDEISDWTTTLRPLLGERVTLDTDNGRDLWMVKADKSQLGQVIVNLAVNARDAMPEDGSVTIRTRNVSAREIARLSEKEILPVDYVLCEVSDTGTGMPEDVLEKIFDPFFSTKEVGKGTGLGLSTVYGIIKQTGGYIFCDSKPGKGTTFRIYLPRHDENASPVAQVTRNPVVEKDEDADMTGSGVVLLVEDEEPVRRLAARALTRQGFKVLEAGSGVEALEVMADVDGTVDLVVSDIVMPEMDGPTLLKELRSEQPDIKLIFISGYAEDALQTLNPDEAFEFLPKPFQLADLVAKVKTTLDA